MQTNEIKKALKAIKKEERYFHLKRQSSQYQKDMADGLLLAQNDKRIITRREFAPTNSPFAYNASYNSKGITKNFTPLLTGCSGITVNTPLTPRILRIKYGTSVKEVKENKQDLPTFSTDRKYYTLISNYTDIISTLHTLKVQAVQQQEKNKWQLLPARFPTIDLKFACLNQNFKNGHLIKGKYLVNYNNIDFTKFAYDAQYQIAINNDFAKLPVTTQQLIIALNKLEQLYAVDVTPLYLENTEIEYLGSKLRIYLYPKKSFYQPFLPKQVYTETQETIQRYNEHLLKAIEFLRQTLANPTCTNYPNVRNLSEKFQLGWGKLANTLNDAIQPFNMLATVQNVQNFLYPHLSGGVIQRHLKKMIYNSLSHIQFNEMFTLVKNFRGRPMYVFDFFGLTHLLQMKEWLFLTEKTREQLKTSLAEYKKGEKITQEQHKKVNKQMNALAQRITCLSQYIATALISEMLPEAVKNIDK